eukprot:COSAG06_NODE_8523_length_2140_cov_12.719745_1_plen_138_part_00
MRAETETRARPDAGADVRWLTLAVTLFCSVLFCSAHLPQTMEVRHPAYEEIQPRATAAAGGGGGGGGGRPTPLLAVRKKRPFFGIFTFENDHFAKTGLGQTEGTLNKRDHMCVFSQANGVLSSSDDDSSGDAMDGVD